MGTKKDFSKAKEIVTAQEALSDKSQKAPPLKLGIPASTVVVLPTEGNASSARNLEFGRFYGKGFDPIVSACQQTTQILVDQSLASEGSTLALSTIEGYFRNGLAYFSKFLEIVYCPSVLKRDLELEDITSSLIESYIVYLKGAYPNGTTAKNKYSLLKSVLIAAQRNGWIETFDWPRNPFPDSNRKVKGETPYSEAEHRRLIEALKSETLAILKTDRALNSYETVICLLQIAVLSGANPTPLLEMTTDAIKPHPLKENRRLLVLYKRRGNATHIQDIRGSTSELVVSTTLPHAETVVNHLIKVGAEGREVLNTDKTFVYYSSARGEFKTLSQGYVTQITTSFTEKYDLKDDSGNPLTVNVSRVRKSFLNRIYKQTGGDLLATAMAGNHSLKVSDSHYMEAGVETEKQFHKLAEIRATELTSDVATPVAHCKKPAQVKPDAKGRCYDWIECLICPSMVLTGDDLHRLFSFYWLVVRERDHLEPKVWKRHFGHIVRIVDQDIIPDLIAKKIKTADEIEALKEEARVNPHPAWIDRSAITPESEDDDL